MSVRLKERYQKFLEYQLENNPEVETELLYENPYQLLVAVILSAQCTDKRVNMVTPAIFLAYPEPRLLAQASFDEVFSLVRSISYPNNKAKHLIGMGKMLHEEFGGIVPESVEDLQKLPGVGRKTANVIASVVYNQPAMAVDTHVFRVSARIGLTRGAKNPLQAEKQLVKHIPEALIPKAHHWLILHGRYVCTARKPQCPKCALTEICGYYQKKEKTNSLTVANLNPAKD